MARHGRFRQLLSALLAVSLSVGPVAPAAAAAEAAAASAPWAPNDDDSLLLEVRLGQYRLAEDLRGYQTPSGVCVDLGDTLSALDVPIKIDASAGTAAGWAFEEANRLEIDRNGGKVRHRESVSALSPASIRDTPAGWCADAEELSDWLGVKIEPDLSNAILFIRSDKKLPVQLAEERKSRAARIRPAAKTPADLPSIQLPYEDWRMPSLDAVVTVGGISDEQRGTRLDARYELYASGEIAKVSVDARLSSDRKGVPDSLRMRAYRTDPQGKLLGPLGATHVAVGDVAGFSSPLVSQSIPGRGAVITNKPVDRPDSFDRTTLIGELPNGWDAELYRNGQLLAVAQDRRDGRYEFVDVQLLYGLNQLEIVLYGPQGQVRRRSEIVNVGPESIASGKTFYWAGVSEDNRDLVNLSKTGEGDGRGWRATAGVEHGIDTKTSIAAQVHSLVLEDERLTFVEGAVRRSVGPALVEVSAAYETGGGYGARALVLAELGNVYISGESVIAKGFRSDRVEPGVTGRHTLSLDHALKLGGAILPTHAEARYVQRKDGNDTLEAAARLSASVRNWSLTAGVDWRQQRGRSGADPPDIVEAAILANGAVGPVRVRGEARWRLAPEARFDGAAVVAQWRASERADWRAELGYDHELSRARGALGYVRRFDRLALNLSAEAATDGSVAAGLNLAFSLGPDPRGGMRLTSNKLASRGTAVARVFRDLNDDGLRQANEPAMEGVQLTAGTAPVTKLTGKDGIVIVDELQPFRPVQIGVDTTSLSDPLLQPKKALVFVTPRPGVAMAIDIPLVGAGEVEGTLVRNGGGGYEGVDLELADAGGRTVATTRTDFDGYFLFDSVAYGDYALRIAKAPAAALGLAPGLRQRIAISTAAPSVRLGIVATAPRQGP
jgi:hypothetical protein